MLDFIRIACAVPEVKVGDVKKNAASVPLWNRQMLRMRILCFSRNWL